MKTALKDSQIQELTKIFGVSNVKTDSESLKYYGKDWTTYYDISSSAIVFPETTEQVSQLVKWARQEKIPLVPSGGRTGLSGGACATSGEVIVSFEKMNRIKEFDPIDQTVQIEAGVVTEALQNFAKEKNLLYPVDFAARGSSQMGGNIATNAGGIKVVRWGLTRNWVAGLTVVTGTGDILNLNRGMIKNATGYDLRHLFIGSEGTLGFITEALIQLTAQPQPLKVLLLGMNSLDQVMTLFSRFKNKTQLTAFEFFSDKALKHVMASTHLPQPLETLCPFYAVAEIECPNEAAESAAMEVFEQGLNEGWLVDGAISMSDQQAKEFWRYREDISESLSRYSPYKNDLSVRIGHVPAFIKSLDSVLSVKYPNWEVVWFGHIGDGNLHINILRPENMTKEEFVRECRSVDPLVFAEIQKFAGSISAEHGVGLSKKSFLSFSRSAEEINLMKQIKSIFDPDGIINPGKIFE